jgi:hypothetical protein
MITISLMFLGRSRQFSGTDESQIVDEAEADFRRLQQKGHGVGVIVDHIDDTTIMRVSRYFADVYREMSYGVPMHERTCFKRF